MTTILLNKNLLMMQNKRIIICFVFVFSFLIFSQLCVAAIPENILQQVEQLYQAILTGTEAEAQQAREQIRSLMENYFNGQGVILEYELPLKEGRWMITQGNSTRYSHQGNNQFSWDFELVDRRGNLHPQGLSHRERPWENYSYGMPIYAVKAGRVWIQDGGIDGQDPSNMIVIHHGDGTRAIYDHIRSGGFTVAMGDNVEKGQLIGYMGYTGTSYPHLHFSIRMKDADNWTLPIRFKEYYFVNLQTQGILYIPHGVPREDQIIAVSQHEAQNPSIPIETGSSFILWQK